jgi:hypothetical protein
MFVWYFDIQVNIAFVLPQDKIRIVFGGYTEICAEKTELVKKFSDEENDWLTKEPDDYIRDHISNMVAYSKMIKAECEKHSLPYFDTSHDFLAATDRATAHLTGDMSG